MTYLLPASTTRPAIPRRFQYAIAAGLGLSLAASAWQQKPVREAVMAPIVEASKVAPVPYLAASANGVKTADQIVAERVIATMEAKGYHINRHPDDINIVFVEEMDVDLNISRAKQIDSWNDVQMIIRFSEHGHPYIAHKAAATTESSSTWTFAPDRNPKGAARLVPGQYRAWQVGYHRNYRAMAQTGGAVTVARDRNADGLRDGDALDTGYFGINLHGGGGGGRVGRYSAGCLVARSMDDHWRFMAAVYGSRQYRQNPQHIFYGTLLKASELKP